MSTTVQNCLHLCFTSIKDVTKTTNFMCYLYIKIICHHSTIKPQDFLRLNWSPLNSRWRCTLSCFGFLSQGCLDMLWCSAHVHKHTHNCRLFPWHEAVWQTCMCGPVPCVWRVTPDLALSSQLHPVWQHQLWPSTLQGVQNSYSILSIILSLIMYCFIHMFHIKLSLFPQTPQILKLIFIYSTCSSWVSSLSHANHVPTGCHLSQEGKQAGCRLSQQACLASPLDTPYTHTHLHTHPWHKQSPLTPSNMPHLTRLWTTALTQMD